MWKRAKNVLLVLGLCVLSSNAGAETPEEQARLHFKAGVNLLQDPARPRYEEAYAEFKQAYALVPSYKILANIGLCAMKLERDAEAIEAYSKYLFEAKDLDPEERAQVERDLATLRAGLATLVVETQPPGASILDTRIVTQGEPVTNVYGPIDKRTELGLRRGHHILRARFPGGREVIWEADLSGKQEHTFVLPEEAPAAALRPVPEEPKRSRPIPPSVFIAGGATAVLGISALATGIAALDKSSEFEAENDGVNPARADDLRGSAKTLNVVTDVLLVSTIVAAGVTAYLFFTRPARDAAPSTTAWSSGIRF